MGKIQQSNDALQPQSAVIQIKSPEIPKAFMGHSKVMYVLCSAISNFGHEEQQAIGYFYYLNLSVTEIAAATKLTENHVISVIILYAERLETKLDLFKKTLKHDPSDVLQVRDILFLEEPENIPTRPDNLLQT
ncbi:MAG: hypothetical protein FWC78_08380 [Defluviitaleaceae bacterium]|nr:hypothetical protein [Defluviitaleaceae bacterium]